MSGTRIRVVVDAQRCSGYANCVAAMPDVFELGGDDIARVLAASYPPQDRSSLERAVALCPAKAISLHETTASLTQCL